MSILARVAASALFDPDLAMDFMSLQAFVGGWLFISDTQPENGV